MEAPNGYEILPENGQAHATWVFTLNNHTEEELLRLKQWDVSRMAIGKEVGAEGTPHLQGFVTFQRTYRLSALKKLAPRAHWERAKVMDWNYCLKLDSEEVFVVDNSKRNGGKGKRKDIDLAYEYAENKRPYVEFLKLRPNYQALRVYEKIAFALKGDRPIAPINVEWHYGSSGTGKSQQAFARFPDLFVADSFKWWDGYEGQDVVLIDDVRGDWCSLRDWLRLTDIYPLRKEVKGGWVKCNFTRLIVTSSMSPDEIWHSFAGSEDYVQLQRRLTEVVEYRKTPLGTVTVKKVRGGNTGLPGQSEPFSPVSLPLYNEQEAESQVQIIDLVPDDASTGEASVAQGAEIQRQEEEEEEVKEIPQGGTRVYEAINFEEHYGSYREVFDDYIDLTE